jgi:flavin-binding protein dodecin
LENVNFQAVTFTPNFYNRSITPRRDKRKVEFSQLKREPEREDVAMPDDVYKVVDLVGTSETSISKAIDGAISKAGETLRQLGWFEVIQIRGRIENGKIHNYQVTLKAGFKLED